MSDNAKSATKNVAALGITRVITWSSTFVLMMFLPRYLGPVDYGRFYLAQSIVAMFSLLVEFGSNYSITKAVSRERNLAPEIVVNAAAVRFVLWLLVFVTVGVYAFVVEYHISVKIMLIIFGVGMIWTNARTILWSAYRGFEMVKYPLYGAMAESVFIAVVGVLAVVSGVGPIGFTIVTVSGTLLNFFICAKFIKKIIPRLPSINWKESINTLKIGFPYFMNSVLGIIYYKINTVMLSFMTPEKVVGWFGASFRFFETMMFLPSIFTIAIFPIMSRLWGEDNTSLSRPMQKSLDFMLLSGVPISIAVFAFSKEIIHLFYGEQFYDQSILLLMIFSAGVLLFYIDIMLGTALLASDKQKQMTINSLLAVIVNITLNYLLIPYTQAHLGNGGIGAAIATLGTELFVMIAMLVIMDRKILTGATVTVQLKALFAGTLMAAAIWLARIIDSHLVIQGMVGITVYIAAVLLTKGVTQHDLALLKHVIPSRLLKNKAQISSTGQ